LPLSSAHIISAYIRLVKRSLFRDEFHAIYDAVLALFTDKVDTLSRAWLATPAGLAFHAKCKTCKRDRQKYPLLTKPSELAWWTCPGTDAKHEGFSNGMDLELLSKLWEPLLLLMPTVEFLPVWLINDFIAECIRVSSGLNAINPE